MLLLLIFKLIILSLIHSTTLESLFTSGTFNVQLISLISFNEQYKIKVLSGELTTVLNSLDETFSML